MYSLLRLVPKAYLSWAIGQLASVRLPVFLRKVIIGTFAKSYSINTEEAEFPVTAYPSVADFFVRRLKPGARKVEDDFVSPVDGTLRSIEAAHEGMLTQVKGNSYSISDLLADSQMAEKFMNGMVYNLYLSPKDYHHVHSPCDGKIIRTDYIPGKLWPVNDWSLSTVNQLFVVNERVVLYIQTAQELVAVVMVGATNVGKMSFPHISLTTNERPWSRSGGFQTQHPQPIPISAGDLIGTFNLGSTVVLCRESKIGSEARAGQVLYGQSLK